MYLEHAIDGTVSHSVLEPWEKLVLWIVVGYASVAVLRLAVRARSLPLLSTRGFIAVVALPAVLGLSATYVEILDVALTLPDPFFRAGEAAFDLAAAQPLLLAGLLASSIVAGAGVLRSQVAADRTAPLRTAIAPAVLLFAADVTLVLQPEHMLRPYALAVASACAVGSFLLLILLTALLLGSRAEQSASRYSRLALAIRALPFPLAAVGLFSVLYYLHGRAGP